MARLPQGVRKRKDGKLEKRFTVNGERYSIYGINTKDIIQKEQAKREEIKQGCYKENSKITLNEYFDKWIKNKEKHVKSNTIHTYTICYNTNIRKSLGRRKIKDIERKEVKEFQTKLTETLNPTSVNYNISVLGIILNDAVMDDIIIKNPASRIRAVKNSSKATESYHRALTKQEQATFMDAFKNNYYYSFVALMLTTGMRCGEVGALTWQDIDYNENVIHVTKTLTKNTKGVTIKGNSTKTDAGKRDIPLNDTIRQILKDHRYQSEVLPFNTCNVFTSAYGNLVVGQYINNAIRSVLRELKDAGVYIEPFTSHALRDTFATRYIEQGGSMQTLKSILGHSSIKMTMDLYSHVLPDTKQEEMDRIQISI